MNSELIDGEEYRMVTIGNRSKLISKDGKAINPIRRNQPCSVSYNKDGYPCFGGGIPVHQYVALGWVDGYFENAEVNHKDCDRTNYCADNLEWVTHADNVRYSADLNHYSKPYGNENPNAKHIYVYDKNMIFINEFDFIKKCAKWLCDLNNKPIDKIRSVQSSISKAIKTGESYLGFLFFKEKQYTQC